MATARLVYETSENLDARTIAHAKTVGATAVSQVEVTNDLIAILGRDRITLRGLDCETHWTAAVEDHVVAICIVGDEVVAIGQEAMEFYRDGKRERRVELGIDWEITHVAFDTTGGQVAIVGVDAQAAIFDLSTGGQVHHWDMTEDYDFGNDWIEIKALLFRDGRMLCVVGQQISVWLDGELEACEWRRGRHLSQHTDEAWQIGDRYLFEATSDSRGVVIYDAQTLEFIAQPGATGDFCRAAGGGVFAWSDQHLTRWDGDQMSFLKPDWRGHYHTTFTPDGRHAVSISLQGEVCVQRVADFQSIDAEPDRIWAMPTTTAFAANSAGTHAAVVWGVPSTMSRVDMIDLTSGKQRSMGKAQPIETLHFLDDQRAFGATGRWANPGAVSTWNVDDNEVITIEQAGEFLGAGKGWIATKVESDEGREIVFHALEGGELHEVSRHAVPDGWDMQEVRTTRYAIGWDDSYNSVLFDFETSNHIVAEDGKLGGDFYATMEWDNEYVLRVRELPSGNEVGLWTGSVADVVVMEDRRQLYFSTHEGQLFGWVPPDAAVELYSSEAGLGTLKKSSDERYLVAEGFVVRVFDAAEPGEPLIELTTSFVAIRAEISGDHLLVGGFHGTYAIYRIER